MAARGIVIAGTGGSGRETLMLLRDIMRAEPDHWDFKGFVAPDPPDDELLTRIDAPFLGDPTTLVERIPNAAQWAYAIGIGNPMYRRRTDDVLGGQGLGRASLIHPTAIVGDDVVIGEGAVICALCVITTDVRIGRSVQLNIGCVVGHDARLGDYVTLAQSVNLAGNVTIGDDATLHTQAIVDRGRCVGAGAIVGSGAVVTRDVEPRATVVGVPARPTVDAP